MALAVLLTGSTLLSAVGTAVLPFSARAQSEGEWVDPLADSQMTDISANVDQTIADVWNGDADDGWVEAAPVDAAPVDAAPTYDANGNMIDPVTGAPLAIGPDGAPIDAAAGLYFDEVGNLIDPATGMAVSYDENGQPGRRGRRPRRTGRSTEASRRRAGRGRSRVGDDALVGAATVRAASGLCELGAAVARSTSRKPVTPSTASFSIAGGRGVARHPGVCR